MNVRIYSMSHAPVTTSTWCEVHGIMEEFDRHQPSLSSPMSPNTERDHLLRGRRPGRKETEVRVRFKALVYVSRYAGCCFRRRLMKVSVAPNYRLE